MRRFALALSALALAVTALPAPGEPLEGMGAVTIYDDDFGVPHVVGETEEAMAYGAGYVVGRDRLWETDVIRRLGQGRLSEILGEDFLEADMIMRREFYDAADVARQVASLPPRLVRLLQAFADGINLAIVEQAADPTKMSVMFGALGYVPEPWRVEDSAAVLLLFTMVNFAGEGEGGEARNAALLADLVADHDGDVDAALAVWQDLLLRNDPGARAVVADGEGPAEAFVSASAPASEQIELALAPGLDAAAASAEGMMATLRSLLDELPVPRIGSYAMAASGDRTASGAPILLGAPQAGFTAPSLFYEMGLHAPGWDCTGFTVPGLGPFMGIGWCNQHAWTLVAGNAGDQVDLVVETLCDGGEGYLYEGSCRPIETRTERYVVRSALPLLEGEPPDAAVATQEIRSTRHGPIFEEDGERAFVFRRAQAGRFTRTWLGTLALNTAQSLPELEEGARQITATYNFVYADAAGTIAYRFTGFQPVRAPAIDHRLPTPGADARFEWQARSLPFWAQPHVTNPADGLIVVDQGVDSKPTWWWPRASDIMINRFGHTAADYDTWGPETALDLARVKAINRLLISDADTLARQIERLVGRALSEEAGALGDAYALFEAWRDAGFPRVDADDDGALDDPAITIFSPDGLNFRRSGLWSRFMDRFWRARTGRPLPGPFVGRLGQTMAAIDSPELFDTVVLGDWKTDLRAALADELAQLEGSFDTADMTQWLAPAPTQGFDALGLIAPGAMDVVDHGTYAQIVDLGSGEGVNINPPGNGRADTALQIAANAGTGEFPPHFVDQIPQYEAFEFKPMKMRPEQYTTDSEAVTTLFYPGVLI